jgi:hypothetical protein
MKGNRKTLAKLLRDDRGQALPWVTVMLVVVMGIAGFVIDLGHAMVCERQLQSSSNAAAMAAVLQLPNSNYATYAHDYGSETGEANVSRNLPGVAMTVTGYCSTTVKGWGVPCLSPSGDNAVVVVQTSSIPTTFARVLGISTVKISATATAAERGSPRAPFNVAIVVDTTQSMTSSDGGTNCSGTRVSCALQGVQDMLEDFSPCYTGLSSCSGQTAVDEVSVFTFPPTSTPSYDYTCPHSGSFNVSSYPDATNLSTTNLIKDYEILGLASDYRTSDSASALSGTSQLVVASGYTGSNCGLNAQGGVGTYYAGAINAAQQYLSQNSRTGADNVMILLSDGDASGSVTVSGQANSVGWTTTNKLNSNGSYPSYKNMCQQGIAEAAAAKSAGTRIYVVAYGAANSSSGYCKTDSPAQNPCSVLQQISGDGNGGTATKYFFADGTSSSGGCTPPSGGQTSLTSLTGIFSAIATDLEVARLIPNGTT